MSFSKKLLANEAYLVSLVKELKKTYKYVSVLGCDHQTIDYLLIRTQLAVLVH